MPSFDVDTTEIIVFEVEDADLYVFSEYFDNDEAFEELSQYYDSENYCFEVPDDDIGSVEALLAEYFYGLHRVPPDDIEPYCWRSDSEGVCA